MLRDFLASSFFPVLACGHFHPLPPPVTHAGLGVWQERSGESQTLTYPSRN